MSFVLFICLYACVQFALAAPSSFCARDTFASLPAAPSVPSSTYKGPLPSGPFVQNHWSVGVTLLRPENTVTTTQTACPFLDASLNLVDWQDPSVWGGSTPANGADVNIPANTNVLISSCSIDPTFVFGQVTIPTSSNLIFGDSPISFSAYGISVYGNLSIGSPTCRLRNYINITLYGERSAITFPALPNIKGISVLGGLDIHGVEYFPTWTRLSATANAGDSTIFIQDCPNWQTGQSIAITTTEIKDSRDWHRNEEAVIQSVQKTSISSTVCAVTLTQPLLYQHYGGVEYQAEVALLSRNILFQGDPLSEPTDTSPIACTQPNSPSTYPCDNTFMTGFGAHIMMQTGATVGRISGLELFRVGQTNILGRYPIHFHLLGNLTGTDEFYVSDTSVHHSFFRCFTIHGTSGVTLENGVTLTKNTGYDIIGHCFFASEDGIEENHTISYNLAAHIHILGPYWQASYAVNIGDDVVVNSDGGQSFYSQYTDYVKSSSALVRADDISASPFYFTNAYSSIFGNAASGGWAGFAFPNLPAPVGDFAGVPNFVPKNRPVIRFQGNSAHSTGYWQGHAAGIYAGGNLVLTNNDPTLQLYTAGRYLPARDTCTNPIYDSVTNTNGCPANDQVWFTIQDTKVFLANVGIQSWGDREEIIRFEVHDVMLSTNVFGEVWIDQMYIDCRSQNNLTWLQGCNTTQWWECNQRDLNYFQGYTGFQFYDTGQSHLLTNTVFANCQTNSSTCLNGQCSITMWSYLTHSDQFTPGLMQQTRNTTYINCDMSKTMSPAYISPIGHVSVSGRDANWLDLDGTVTKYFPGSLVNIGSNFSGPDWWRYNDNCVNSQRNWICALAASDDKVSLSVHWATTNSGPQESQIGNGYCSNGAIDGQGDYWPCPIGATITHFNRNEANAYDVALSCRVTGPVIAALGGWFIRYLGGTPNKVYFTDMQIPHETILHVAIPYPAGTTFSVYAQAPTWCNPGTPPFHFWNAICTHYYREVSSIAEVRASWGDAYFFDPVQQLLHVRIISLDSFTAQDFATNGTYAQSTVWNSSSTWNTYFSRGGLNLLVSGNGYFSVVIEATNCNPKCADLSHVVTVPGINGSADYTGPAQTPTNFSGLNIYSSANSHVCGLGLVLLGWVLFLLLG